MRYLCGRSAVIDRTFWFLSAAMDPDYYTPSEAAFLFKPGLSDADWHRLTRRFREQSPGRSVAPGQSTEGYLLVNRREGGRYVTIELAAHEKLLRFGFAIPVADGQFDFEQLLPAQIYQQPSPGLDEQGLRTALEELACCTTRVSASLALPAAWEALSRRTGAPN